MATSASVRVSLSLSRLKSMQKKIYFAGSIRGGRVDANHYRRMIGAQFAFLGVLDFPYFYSLVFKTIYPVTIKKMTGINKNLINNLRDKDGNPLYHF